jgi:predicted metalloendopeptidase
LIKSISFSRLQISFSLVLLLTVQIFNGSFAIAAETAIIDLDAIDQSINPCENFYKYSCGAWQEKTVIPADKSSYYRQSGDLQDKTDLQLNHILESYAQGKFEPYVQGAEKLGQIYKSCMQPMAVTEEKSFNRVKENLHIINKIDSMRDLAEVVAHQHLLGISSLFGVYSSSDYNDSSKVIAFLDQGGLSLPEKAYYFPESERGKFILAAYKEHLAKFLYLSFAELKEPISMQEAQNKAKLILYLETNLAQASLSLEESQDSSKLNNVMSLAKFENILPSFAWSTYWKALGASPAQLKNVNVTVPKFFMKLQRELKHAEEKPYYLSIIKTYLQWKFLMNTNSWYSDKVHNEFFQFWGKTLQGKKEMKPRWKTCMYFAADAMNEALAEAYIGLYPANELMQKTQLMINQIKTAFGENLQTLSWIDEPTKKAALVKLAVMKEKIGFPSKWKSYSTLNINDNDPLLNYINVENFAVRDDLNKIGKPVDLSLWAMNVWEANAYYDPSLNEFVFPLGELLPPILDLSASDGANFGAIGATIGHELTHGYDSDGSQFDENGNIRQWWTDSVRKNFDSKAQCFIDQANQYEALPHVFVNGAQTINENLADIGGLKLSYLAYKKVAAQRSPAVNYGGYNEDQQFFLSYAQSWCEKISTETLEEQVKSDVHPPADFRVNAVMMNFPDFAKAFNCQIGQNTLAPAQHCELW